MIVLPGLLGLRLLSPLELFDAVVVVVVVVVVVCAVLKFSDRVTA